MDSTLRYSKGLLVTVIGPLMDARFTAKQIAATLMSTPEIFKFPFRVGLARLFKRALVENRNEKGPSHYH